MLLEEKNNGKKSLESASVVEKIADDNEVDTDLLSISSGNNAILEYGVLDSTYSYHMTPKKD